MAASLVSKPLLVRADAGFCSLKLMTSIAKQANLVACAMAFIIKWNPRTSPTEAIAAKRVADAPVRHKDKRCRINTAIQELMFKAAPMICNAWLWVLGLGESVPALTVVERHYRHHSMA